MMASAHADDRPQLDKFRDLARELECDDDEAAFAARLRKVATAPADPPVSKQPDRAKG
jgi:hypothetical protein